MKYKISKTDRLNMPDGDPKPEGPSNPDNGETGDK